MTPELKDNDRDEVTAIVNGIVIRGWGYDPELLGVTKGSYRLAWLRANEFVAGWSAAMKHATGQEVEPDHTVTGAAG
jgi:hypothetical protein